MKVMVHSMVQIDQMKSCIGREWQMGTIQLDYQLPLNFDMKYVAADGSMKRPVMVHRAIFGSIEIYRNFD